MLEEKLPVQQLIHWQIPSGLEIKSCPVQIFDAPPFAVEIHGKTLRHGGADRAVPDKADEVCVLMEADALDALVIHGVDAARQIGKAVAKVFNVHVKGVNTVNVTGKKKRMGRTEGKRADYKKAIVTLAPGESIEFFEA